MKSYFYCLGSDCKRVGGLTDRQSFLFSEVNDFTINLWKCSNSAIEQSARLIAIESLGRIICRIDKPQRRMSSIPQSDIERF
jgi:hypothetical protein